MTRSTKVINNETNTHMQSSPFRILSISNNHSRQSAKTTCKQANLGQQSQLLTPIPVTNPSNRAGRCGGGGKSPQSARKESQYY